MIVPVNLRPEQTDAIRKLRNVSQSMIIRRRDRATTVNDLARLKKSCEDFLAIPIVQAIHTEGID